MADNEELMPPLPSEIAFWIYDHRVSGIRVDYRMTGDDTAETWLILTGFDNGRGKTPTFECRPYDFNAVAELKIGFNTCAQLKYGQTENIASYRSFIKRNQRELSEYRRLQRKFRESINE